MHCVRGSGMVYELTGSLRGYREEECGMTARGAWQRLWKQQILGEGGISCCVSLFYRLFFLFQCMEMQIERR